MSNGVQIVVIDDDAADRGRVQEFLQAQGFEVRAFDDGVRALVEIDASQPGLILLEMDLPRLGGVDLARAIRAHAETRHIPVMFLSKKTDPRSMIEGINVGAKSYMTKPFEADDLLSKVKKAIA